MAMKLKKQLTYFGYATAWKIIGLLPEPTVYALANLAADRITRRNGISVQRLRDNYQRVHPTASQPMLDEMVREGMRSYLRYWCDTFRFPKWSHAQILGRVVVEREELLTEPLLAKRGCVVALPHAGNWDHAGAYFCLRGFRLTTVAEHLEPEQLFRKFLTYRENMGMEVLDLDTRVLATLAQRLRSGKLVALVADRDLTQSGVKVDFISGTASMPGGPAALALQTGAPLITAYVAYEPKGIRIIFDPEILPPTDGTQAEKVAAMTQAVAERFAQRISERTSDWHMLQQVWLNREDAGATK